MEDHDRDPSTGDDLKSLRDLRRTIKLLRTIVDYRVSIMIDHELFVD